MKKCLLILCLSVLRVIPCLAQVPAQEEPDPAVKQARYDRMVLLEWAYVNQQLNLTPEESNKLLPVFLQYKKDLNSVNTNATLDEIAREEAVLNIRKRYQEQFTQLLGRNRSTYFFQTERNFRDLLIRRLNHTPPPNRMGMRKGY
jgi:hypothetical protein